jgi:hypothetical protein
MKKKEENKNLKLSKVERYVRGPSLASGVFEVPGLVTQITRFWFFRLFGFSQIFVQLLSNG